MKVVTIDFPMKDDVMKFIYFKGENNAELMRRKWEDDIHKLLATNIEVSDFMQSVVKNIYGSDKELYVKAAQEQSCPHWKEYALGLFVEKGRPPLRFIRLVIDHVYGAGVYFSVRKITNEHSAEGKVISIAS